MPRADGEAPSYVNRCVNHNTSVSLKGHWYYHLVAYPLNPERDT